MKNIIFSLLIYFKISTNAYAFFGLFGSSSSKKVDCPPKTVQTKECPEGSSRILDDTYPTQAVVISNAPYNTSNLSYHTPAIFVLEAIKAYRGQKTEKVPMFIIPIRSNSRVDRIKELVEEGLLQSGYPIEEVDKLKSRIVQAKVLGYTWQQDYFESFYDLSSGAPEIRNFKSYKSKFHMSRKSSEKISSALSDSSCNTQIGPPLPEDPRSSGNGEMGGNLEGLPGGGCLYGDNLGDGLAQSICQDKKDHSQIFTSWLEVGHVDEIIKITPGNKNSNVPPECNFTINAASPMKALELLKKDPNKTLIDPPPAGVSERPYYENRKQKLCGVYPNIIRAKKKQKSITPKETPRHDSKGVFNLILPSTSHAGMVRHIGKLLRECTIENIKKMTNQDFIDAVTNTPDLFELNEVIEKTMEENLKKITDTISRRLPQCTQFIDVMRVPDFYYSPSPTSKIIEHNGKKILAKNGDSLSFFPSPTNGVFLNETMIYSDNEVSVFKNYLKNQMEQRGNQARFIRTYEYAHMGEGNLHCSSHTIPFCRPRK